MNPEVVNFLVEASVPLVTVAGVFYAGHLLAKFAHGAKENRYAE